MARTHDPARKRQPFRVKRRLKFKPARDDGKASEALGGPHEAELCKAMSKSLRQVAPLLWSADYKPHLDMEVRQLHDIGVLEAAAGVKVAAPPSTCAARKLTRDKEKAAIKVIDQMRDTGAAAVRQANQQTYPFSICARSVATVSYTHLTLPTICSV